MTSFDPHADQTSSSKSQEIPASTNLPEPMPTPSRIGDDANCVPEQFFADARESHALWNGERLLLLAVLENAFHEFRKYRHARTRRGKRLFQEAADWFWSEEKNYLYSFESICFYLHFDPDAIRRELVRQKSLKDAEPQAIRARHRISHTSFRISAYDLAA